MDILDRIMSHVNKTDGCWLWISCTRNGYGTLKLNGKAVLAHRICYQIYHGKIEDGLNVLHKCNNRLCVNPAHLYAGTQKENVRDSIEAKTHFFPNQSNKHAFGAKASRANLTDVIVYEIKKKNKGGVGLTALANEYGVCKKTIWNIVTNKHWNHVQYP